jgi:hypothetical protein
MTVLITTANNPPADMPILEMKDPVMRKIAAKAALYFWVAQGIEQIVLADATGTNLLTPQEEAEIDETETRLEQINYIQNNEEVVRRGKGYAEGKLIEFAIDNSELLARQEHFFKCTGKVYVRNFTNIAAVIRNNNITNFFWRHMGDGTSTQSWADCRFYYASKTLVRSLLIPAYLASDDREAACEWHIHHALERNVPVARGLRPFLTGYIGGSGEPYFDATLGVLDQNFPCWVSRR